MTCELDYFKDIYIVLEPADHVKEKASPNDKQSEELAMGNQLGICFKNELETQFKMP